MCGIVACCGTGAGWRWCVDVPFSDGSFKLRYRGYASAGLAFVGLDVLRMLREIRPLENPASTAGGPSGDPLRVHPGMGHARSATQRRPPRASAHPYVSTVRGGPEAAVVR